MRGSHAAIALSLCALGAPAASAASATTTGGAIACPEGFGTDVDRADFILDRVASVHSAHLQGPRHTWELARGITRTIKPTSMCFGQTDVSVVSFDGMLLLDARADDRALAARTLHLAMHLADPSRFDPTKRAEHECGQWVDAVLRAEAEAYAVELDGARELGVKTPYTFFSVEEEEGQRSSNRGEDKAEERVAIITAFLRAHPDGSPGIEPLARGYAERCRAVSSANTTADQH